MLTDTISRKAVIDLVEEVENKRLKGEIDLTYAPTINGIMALPSAEPEPSIPLSWIEEHIKWLKSFDNEFANLSAKLISVMVTFALEEQEAK